MPEMSSQLQPTATPNTVPRPATVIYKTQPPAGQVLTIPAGFTITIPRR